MTELPGALIAGRYRLIAEIGRGGCGVVWRAHDERLCRDVAAKEPLPPVRADPARLAERRRRTLREARSAARVAHPAAITVYDVAEHDGRPWLIMELINGRALSSLVKRDGPLPPHRAARIGLQILGALQAAHAAGILHRDVKPANVLIGTLGGRDRAVLTDFGIAARADEPVPAGSVPVLGAPSYTAPERARGEPAVPASDLWSLGATLFYAVEGHRPYPAAGAGAVRHAVLTCEPPYPVHAGPLAPVITGLMRRDAADRLTAAQTAALLHQAIAPARHARRPGPARAGRGAPAHTGRQALAKAAALIAGRSDAGREHPRAASGPVPRRALQPPARRRRRTDGTT